MSRALLALVTLTLLCAGPRPAQAKPLTVKDLLAVKWVSGVTLSPDGTLAAFVVSEARRDENKRHTSIYLASTSGSRRVVRRLTSAPGMNAAPAFSPDSKRIAFVSSRGGGDEPQLWVIAVDGGEATQLTKISTGAGRPVWSPDGKLIAFSSSVFPDCKDDACNAKRLKAQQQSKVKAQVFDALLIRHWNHWRDARRSHVLVVAAEPGAKARDLTPGSADAPPISLGSNLDYVFSPDGKQLAFVSNTDKVVATSTNNDVFEVPVRGGRAVRISTSKGNDCAPRYSPDGRYLAYLSMAQAGYESDHPRLIVRDRRTGSEQQWVPGFADHALELVWSADSQRIYFNAPYRGFVELFSARGKELEQLTRGAYTKDLSLSADGRVLAFSSQAADRPAEVHALELAGGRAQGAPRALTALNAWLVKQAGFQRAEHVWYGSDGGKKIHAILVKPPGFAAGRRYPAVVMIHGGPQGMTGDDFHPRWNLQLLAAAGYVVFGPNFHGSVGFGQPFTDAIRGDWGGQPYRDVLRGVEHLARLPFVDGRRIGAVGASYGGYLVNWIATQTERFRCLISHAGLFNMESKYGSTDELWFPEWEFRGTPWTNRAMYRRWSPHNFADKIRTPMLVVHGQNDFRVPVEQAFQLFTTLQRQGVPSRLLYFPDEDHFVQKPQNAELWWQTMHDWLGRYLRGGR